MQSAPLPKVISRALWSLVVLAMLGWGAEPGFSSSVTKGLIDHYSSRYGPDAARRLGEWGELPRQVKTATSAAGGPVQTLAAGDTNALDRVNAFFNRLPFVSDQEHWSSEDYWATPAEMLSSNGGDCEDFSIAKYFMLKELGVPVARMRMVYVKSLKLNQAHMVLAYYTAPQAEPLILDNLEGRIRPASQRTDLVPVYSFNDEDVRAAATSFATSLGGPTQLRQWRSLRQRLQQELTL
jgi:predicted transglutaminase-like cysteine proteinase